MRTALWIALAATLAACVAPEPPPVAHSAVAPPPPPSRVGFEDAPLPNHKIGPTNDSIIRMGH